MLSRLGICIATEPRNGWTLTSKGDFPLALSSLGSASEILPLSLSSKIGVSEKFWASLGLACVLPVCWATGALCLE